jgi:hypothetical protein
VSDGSTGRILAALERLEAQVAQTATRDDVAKLRADLMARMDRLQSRMDSLDEHLTMGLGHTDQVDQRSRVATQAVLEDNRLLGEQVTSLHKLIRMLEARVNQLEDRQ